MNWSSTDVIVLILVIIVALVMIGVYIGNKLKK